MPNASKMLLSDLVTATVSSFGSGIVTNVTLLWDGIVGYAKNVFTSNASPYEYIQGPVL
jgi:hypothetical protein